MTATEFRAALKALGISQRWLAGRLRVTTQTVNRWAQGELSVPQYVIFALVAVRCLAEERPEDWREVLERGVTPSNDGPGSISG